MIPDFGSTEEQECEAAITAIVGMIAEAKPRWLWEQIVIAVKLRCANRTHFVRQPQHWQPLPPGCPVPSQGAARGDRPFDLLHSYFLQDEGKLEKGN